MTARACVLAVVAAAVTTVGCGGDSPSSGALQTWADAVEGIYRIDAMTRNEAACDAEGSSTLVDAGDHVAVFRGSDFGGAWIKVMGCADPTVCRARVADVRAQRAVAFAFSYDLRTASTDKLEGIWITTGFSGQGTGQCTDASLTNIALTRPAMEQIRVEARSIVVDHPADAEGICWTDATKSAAAGKPCSELEVMTATRLEAL